MPGAPMPMAGGDADGANGESGPRITFLLVADPPAGDAARERNRLVQSLLAPR